jgi:hypothetical protein
MLKFFSWTLASIILIVDLVLIGPLTIVRAYFPATFWSTWTPEEGPPMPIPIIGFLSYCLIVIFPILLSFFAIRPRMREIYKDSKFLRNLSKQVLLFLAAVLLYLLVTGFIEIIILGANSPSMPKYP